MLYTSPLLQPIGFVYRRPLPFHLHKIIALPTVRRHPGPRRFLYHTVLRSVITLTTLPNPAISTHFSCQLNNTLIAWPPPSPPPRECTCENPVGCGDMVRKEAEVDCEEWDMPLYRYFIKTSSASVPPSELYIRPSIGDMSDCFMDWRISTTVAR